MGSGWRIRSEASIRLRRLRVVGQNKYGKCFLTAPMEADFAFVRVPKAFKHDVTFSARTQVRKAWREHQSGQTAHSLRMASSAALLHGEIDLAEAKYDDLVRKQC